MGQAGENTVLVKTYLENRREACFLTQYFNSHAVQLIGRMCRSNLR